MQRVSWKKRVMAGTIVGGLALLPAPNTRADFVWNGAGEGDLWTDGDNWVGGAAPGFDLGGNDLTFGATGEDQSPDARTGNYSSIGSIAFTGADAQLTLRGSGSLSLVDGGTITNDSTFKQTINIRLIGNGDSLVLNALTGNLTIGKAIDLSDTGGVELSVLGDNDTVIRGSIRGAGGSLLKDGAGVLTLEGFNPYDGDTELAAGTIIIGSSFALGSGDLLVTGHSAIESDDDIRNVGNDVSIDDAVTLTFSGANDLWLRGEISGDGALAVDADENGVKLTLTGDNTYTGGTTLTKGVIVLGHDNALGTGDLTLAGNGTIQSDNSLREVDNDIDNAGNRLTFSGANDLTLTGEISGTGGLRLSGNGSLTLTGDHTYTGDTNINRGEMILDGSVDSRVLVNDGGTLSGDGSMMGDLTNADGGTVSPGSGVGTFTVEGLYDQQTGSTLLVELNADNGRSDLLDVTWTATLAAGSTVETSFAGDGFIVTGQTITVLEADGGITDNGAEITTDSATVQWIRDRGFTNGDTSYALQLDRAANAYSAASDPGNNLAIGFSLDSLIDIANSSPTGQAGEILGRLDALSASDYNTAVTQLSPEPYNVVTAIGVDSAQAFTAQQSAYLAAKRSGIEALAVRAGSPRPGSLALAEHNPAILAAAIAQMENAESQETVASSDDRWGSYVKVQAVFSDQNTSNYRTGYDADSFGGQVGFDYRFTQDFTAGIALGSTFTNADLRDDLGEIDDNAIRIGPYVSLTNGDWYADGSVTFAYHFYDGERNIQALSQTASSDYTGYELSAYLGTGYHFEIDKNLYLTPSVSAQYSYFNFDEFTESGAPGANLTVADRQSDSLRSRLGASLWYKIDLEVTVLPMIFAGWEHEFFDDGEIEAAFAAGGSPFIIDTGSRATDSAFFGVGVDVLIEQNISAFLRFERAMADDGDVSGIAAGVGFTF